MINNTFSTLITEDTTLGDLLTIIGTVSKAEKTPTSKALRETAGEPIATEDQCKVYANGYAVYDNGSGRTVLWLPACVSFTYRFNPMKDSEMGGEIKQVCDLPEGMLESLPWMIAVTLIGDHRIENLAMQRKGDRKQNKCYASTYQYDKERESAVTEEERTINFEVRYCEELKDLDSTHYRVAFHGDSYDIQTVDFMNYQRKTIRIVCKLQKKGGA